MRQTKRAFTTMDMIGILGNLFILIVILGPKLIGDPPNRSTQAIDDIISLETAVLLYQYNTDQLPKELNDLLHPPDGVQGWAGPYLDRKMKDPWNRYYEYRVPGHDGSRFEIRSLGRDGKEGGEGPDTDIASWERFE